MADANDNLPSTQETNELLANHPALFNYAFYSWYEVFNGAFKDAAGRPDALPFKATRSVQEWIMFQFSNMILQLHRAQQAAVPAVGKVEDNGPAGDQEEEEDLEEEFLNEEES